jgi:aminodeoxychorismate lyase
LSAPQITVQRDFVPSSDRAFLYGDAVFETLLCINGTPLWPELHLDRLMYGAERLAIEVLRADVAAALAAAAASCAGNSVLRLTLSRAGERRGYRPESRVGARLTPSLAALATDPLQPLPAARIGLASVVLAEQPLLAGIKHCNRLEQVLAAAEADQRGLDDVLMATADGCIQCTTNANVFLLRGQELLTPGCTRAGIAGTRRRLIMQELAPAAGLGTDECELRMADLLDADAVFLSNSIMGLRSVAMVEERAVTTAAVIEQLQADYRRAAMACIASS